MNRSTSAPGADGRWPIDRLIAALDELPERDLPVAPVLSVLARHPVAPDSLEPFLAWDEQRYPRNLIHKTPLCELLALCWEPGHRAAIHNHDGQLCWMAVPLGRLAVQNYRAKAQDPVTFFCELEAPAAYEMGPPSPLAVEPGEPIHDVANPTAFGGRAVSLHIYSRPFDHCLVYDLAGERYASRRLHYTTVCGKTAPDRGTEPARRA